MEIIQIVAIGFVSAILALMLRREKPEFSLLIGLCTSILIFFLILPRLSAVLSLLQEISEKINVDAGYIGVVLKVVGIAYIAEFGMQLCLDAGEGVIASKIELAGKVLIMVASMPILLSLMNTILSLV